MAPGLAHYVARPGKTIKLIASPYVDADDHLAIDRGVKTPADVLERRLLELCGAAEVTKSALIAHTLDCLAYLIAAKRLIMKVSFVPGGMFHSKVWIFEQAADVVVLHGSSNLTSPGLLHNVEQVSVSRSWRGEDQLATVREFVDEFEALWHRQRSYAHVIDLPEAVERDLLQRRVNSTPPTPDQFWDAWREDQRQGIIVDTPTSPAIAAATKRSFVIPSHLNYFAGPFAHQGRAVAAWEEGGRRGVLEMATGSGKTLTALIAAQRLFQEDGRLLLVIAAPYLPLIEQWRQEAQLFGLTAIVPNDTSTRRRRLAAVEGAVRRVSNAVSPAEAVVVTHDMLCDKDFQAVIERCRATTMLIGDEAHNLGRDAFTNHPPSSFEARLGLSATPIRQYDLEGTQAIFDYFGPVVFRFTLEDAIGVCLVPYEYFAHPVVLDEHEAREYAELTQKLRRAGWVGKASGTEVDDHIQRLLVRRRRVLEQATGKLGVLEELISTAGPRRIHRSLVYASAKGRGQLQSINHMLSRLGVHFHQLTAMETARPQLASEILDAFANGKLQALTAMKVLDEGVNIPEVETAYIVASTTVEREWVQRRGRVLRTCAATGKASATIHDFLVLPPAGADDDTRGLLRGEVARIKEFARLASNAGAVDGAYSVVQDVMNEFFG
jgi:superfamily II DNA or RNA helicase